MFFAVFLEQQQQIWVSLWLSIFPNLYAIFFLFSGKPAVLLLSITMEIGALHSAESYDVEETASIFLLVFTRMRRPLHGMFMVGRFQEYFNDSF
ncbi:hypothetical protein XELAEV_18040089mg [Xenopus laevis]|uniref:Uncharacterized protein n=1 Tax=Xenopus laevis TaxID=8355 RepID=A0A974C926_XENLA|nr:hypothetical protein XELAEV_18040089mg [Xenopus laevis]